MTQSNCRIGRVRLKSGTHIVPLRTGPSEDALYVRKTLRRHARLIGDDHNTLAGFVIVAWGHDRLRSASVHSASSAPVNSLEIGDFVREAVRDRQRDMETDRIIDERFS